jgi:glucosamine-6-phosphate deaminase
MEVIILPGASEVVALAARIVTTTVGDNPRAVLGLATGKTQEGVYAELVVAHRAGRVSFREATTFNLDEYVGLGASDPNSYRWYMREHFFRHVDLAPERAHVPDGLANDVARASRDYEAAIRAAGGVDLQLLGIGEDGHIGFNEPSSSLRSRTRLKTLTDKTIAGRSGIPRHEITMGIGTILDARRCLLLAFGKAKAAAVAKMIEGPLTASVPASALQLHERTTVIVDEAAAAQLVLGDYYREVYRNKPDWQRE